MSNVCKWCGKKLTKSDIKRHSMACNCCQNKSYLLPRFVKARDDLRERLGMKRMG